ncbi:MAG TPA: hypothetical protein VJ486_06295 [Geothrix sp.]|nr:hypothetical protein [Geothrix sp.]
MKNPLQPLLACALGALVIACGGSGGGTATQPPPPPPPGSITVAVANTPEPDTAPLTLKGAGGRSHPLTPTFGLAHLDGLAPGTYTLQAEPQLVNEVQTYNPVSPSQSVHILSSQTTEVTVTYTPGPLLPHGTLTVHATGLPAGGFAIAAYSFSSPSDPSTIHAHLFTFDGTGLSFPAAPGTYMFQPCTVNGLTGTSQPGSVQVAENAETVVEYIFAP